LRVIARLGRLDECQGEILLFGRAKQVTGGQSLALEPSFQNTFAVGQLRINF
jgi:hypothetical protein